MVHCGICVSCILGFVKWVYCGTPSVSITYLMSYHIPFGKGDGKFFRHSSYCISNLVLSDVIQCHMISGDAIVWSFVKHSEFFRRRHSTDVLKMTWYWSHTICVEKQKFWDTSLIIIMLSLFWWRHFGVIDRHTICNGLLLWSITWYPSIPMGCQAGSVLWNGS